jgi:Holliday junction resolvasome RuvABC endonuclease subunit
MAIRTFTIHGVDPESRAKGAAILRKQLQQALQSPVLSSEQRIEIQDRLRGIATWETTGVAPQVTPERVPQNHVVEVSESLTIQESTT